ncbi:MAG: hypothetical protein JWQ01_1139 [Massilia sp.]|nr:hypothetical protein [Massilia sp.]
MAGSTTYTLRETAFVFGDKLRNIVRTIEEHPELAIKEARGNRSLRVLGMQDLIYLEALNGVGELLTPKGRFQLHEALLKGAAQQEVVVGKFSLAVDDLLSSVEKRLNALATLRGGVEGNPDDPLIKGTRVEVYRIAALLGGGATPQMVLGDYPSLTQAQVELAGAYAEAIPKKGRPYPKISFKRALDALDLSALDEVLDDGSK